jgi:hypothetical protein
LRPPFFKLLRIRMRIWEAPKHTNPADLEDCYIYILLQRLKSHKESHKTVEIKVFLLFLLFDGRIREAQKQTDPTDPDPQRCLEAGLPIYIRSLQPSQQSIQHFKHIISFLFSFSVPHFCLPGSGSNRIRIRIRKLPKGF